MTDEQFIDYCMSFYGPDGLYDRNFNTTEIRLALDLLKCRLASEGSEFVGDTIDREFIRDIILDARSSNENATC